MREVTVVKEAKLGQAMTIEMKVAMRVTRKKKLDIS